MREQHKKLLRLVLTALLVALVFSGSKLEIILPLSVGGNSRFHLGNIMCALSGILLGPWWGGLAAGLGSALYDCTNVLYITEAPITFLTKGLYGLIAGAIFWGVFRRRATYPAMAVSTICAAVSYMLIYLAKTFFYNSMFLEGLSAPAAWTAVVLKVPSALFNGGVAIVLAPLLSMAVLRAMRLAHMDENFLK